MTIFHAIILGIVEGLTEFLPISSTGHLILTSYFLRIPDAEFVKSFEIIIQLGAILAVVVLYFRSFLNIGILKKLAVAFIPTGIIGLLLYKILKTYFLGSTSIVAWSLFIGGIVLIAFELYIRRAPVPYDEIENMSYRQAFGIGLFQAAAIIPGVSRSAATIVGGMILGMSRVAIVEFSFLLAVPTMAAATGLDLVKSASAFSAADAFMLAVGFVVSFVVAIVAISYFLRYVRSHTFIPFGIYRIVVALAFLSLL